MIDQPEPRELPKVCCGKCDHAQHGPSHKPGDQLACRRFPPTLMYVAVPRQNLAGDQGIGWNTAAGFALVTEDARCGEFKPLEHHAILKS